ncbi:MAG: glycosyltransferase [Candidatus Planktophila sp.]|jgi:cellulose synthase/poly-beta-1,6-N-acetylglucosamine synthase-like glycosyltransferase|nr:glycosyltransferase [Candidatus Planktophila sp.]MBP7805356.1 glycosyltransferase [Candidatus Planktophila sp.]
MLELSLLFCILALLITILNVFSIITPRSGGQIAQKVSVLVPLRDEEENSVAIVETLAAQENLSDVEFLILNDNSTDKTYDLVTRTARSDSRFKILQGSALPDGWLGKPWALEQLSQSARGEMLICIDADVRLSKTAIAAAVDSMQKHSLDFFSPYPSQVARTFGERMIQPLLQWSWLSSVPLAIAKRSSNPSFAVANGQFFAVTKAALLQSGGYSSIKNEVLDDMQMARVLLRNRFKGTVGNGALIAQCHMYSSWSELRNGYAKSLWKGFGGLFGSIIAIALLVLTGIIPILSAAMGSPLGWFAFEAVLVSRLISAKITRANLFDALLHPISSALLIYLIIYSWLMRGRIQWKGRTV